MVDCRCHTMGRNKSFDQTRRKRYDIKQWQFWKFLLQGIDKIKKDSKLKQFLAEMGYLFSRTNYMIPFIMNQAGSVLYYFTLASAEISLAVPLTNSLTFIFTMISGHLLGEQIKNKTTYVGIALVLVGVCLCVLSKAWTNTTRVSLSQNPRCLSKTDITVTNIPGHCKVP